MSKTLNKLVYSILESVSNFSLNDDFPIPELWLEDQIITQHASLIRKAQKERRIDEELYITDQLEVKKFDSSFTMSGILINNHNDFCYADMNPLMTGLKGKEIDFVTNIGYSTIYIRKPIRTILRGSAGYYNFSKPSYAIMRNKMIFKAGDMMGSKYVIVNGIWADPRLADGYDKDEKFPTPSEKNLEILTIQHIDHALQHNPDLINDAQRVYSQQSPKPQRSEQD